MKLGLISTYSTRNLGDAAIYSEEKKEELKTLLLDQAYVGKELEELESEWLVKQAELEQGPA